MMREKGIEDAGMNTTEETAIIIAQSVRSQSDQCDRKIIQPAATCLGLKILQLICFPYLIPMTMESEPISGSTCVVENPASLIHSMQSAPV